MYHLYDIRSEDSLSYDEHGFATLFSCPDARVAFARLAPGSNGLDEHAHADLEDNAHVLTGVLTYKMGEGKQALVAKDSWVVARPGEVHGYANTGARPVSLFLFFPRSLKRGTLGNLRVYRPFDVKGARIVIFETAGSRGEVLSLHPGEPARLAPAACSAVMVTDGRVMALMQREKISLDSGEGIAFTRESVDIVGVGGVSHVVVFTTLS